jgi:hypothetical protein
MLGGDGRWAILWNLIANFERTAKENGSSLYDVPVSIHSMISCVWTPTQGDSMPRCLEGTH